MQQNSVTLWIRAVENQDESAAQALFDRYFHRLQAFARKRLAKGSRRVVDEEDIAIGAFHAFLAQVSSEGSPNLKDRDELWRFLVKITERKVCDALRKHLSAKRGGGRVRGESIFYRPGAEATSGINHVPDGDGGEKLAIEFADEYRKLMSLLEDEALQEVARLVLAGFSTNDIAQQTNRTQRTVQRRIRMILEIWNKSHSDSAPPKEPSPKKAA